MDKTCENYKDCGLPYCLYGNCPEYKRKIKPILFNTDMVKAILEGRKTQTRRVIKTKSKNACGFYVTHRQCDGEFTGVYDYDEDERMFENPQTPPCKTGDILWVRETWAKIEDFKNYADMKIDKDLKYLYKVDDNGKEHTFVDVGVQKWKPSIHMPKDAARIFLKVTDVRVERIQEIDKNWSNYDKEGMRDTRIECWWNAAQQKFIDVWNSCYDFHNRWDSNPWVWVIEFERVR